MIVSGDLTWRASAEEFALARTGLLGIASWARLGGDAHRTALIPGNHDLRYSSTPEDPEAEVSLVPGEARAAYEEFYRALFHRSPNEFLSAGRRFLVGESIPVEIVLLNSSLLEQVGGGGETATRSMRFQGQGHIGEGQLRDAAERMGWPTPRVGRTIRIVVLHHHLIPVSYSEPAQFGANYSTVLDSGRLMRWLVTNRVDIVLHGHQHEPFVASVARPVDPTDTSLGWHRFHVVGIGSSGVAAQHRPRDVPNVYGTIDFAADKVEVTMWTVDETHPSEVYARFVLDLAEA